MSRFRRRLVRSVSVLVVSVVLAACQAAPATWNKIPATPEATLVTDVPQALTERLDSRLRERKLQVMSSRVERLPDGADWETHLRWRGSHDGLMSRRYDRVPEPDAPVLIAEFSQGSRTLFVIGVADDSGKQLVVLTALTKYA
jgi:hypothetical protein